MGGGDVHYLAQRDDINTDDQNERKKNQIKKKFKFKRVRRKKSNVLHFTFQKILNYEIYKKRNKSEGVIIMNQSKL